MAKPKLWKILGSILFGAALSPFVGALVSNIFTPYAESDAEISNTFEVSTIIAFPILVAVAFMLLQQFFSGR